MLCKTVTHIEILRESSIYCKNSKLKTHTHTEDQALDLVSRGHGLSSRHVLYCSSRWWRLTQRRHWLDCNDTSAMFALFRGRSIVTHISVLEINRSLFLISIDGLFFVYPRSSFPSSRGGEQIKQMVDALWTYNMSTALLVSHTAQHAVPVSCSLLLLLLSVSPFLYF